MITDETKLLVAKGYLKQFQYAKEVLENAAATLTEYPDNFVNEIQLMAVRTIIDNLDHEIYEFENKVEID